MTCRVTYDLETSIEPKAGDYLASQGKRGVGSVYLIVGVRLVRRRKVVKGNRWMLTCQRAPAVDLIIPGIRVWPMYWYPRDKKRQPKSLKATKR